MYSFPLNFSLAAFNRPEAGVRCLLAASLSDLQHIFGSVEDRAARILGDALEAPVHEIQAPAHIKDGLTRALAAVPLAFVDKAQELVAFLIDIELQSPDTQLFKKVLPNLLQVSGLFSGYGPSGARISLVSGIVKKLNRWGVFQERHLVLNAAKGTLSLSKVRRSEHQRVFRVDRLTVEQDDQDELIWMLRGPRPESDADATDAAQAPKDDLEPLCIKFSNPAEASAWYARLAALSAELQRRRAPRAAPSAVTVATHLYSTPAAASGRAGLWAAEVPMETIPNVEEFETEASRGSQLVRAKARLHHLLITDALPVILRAVQETSAIVRRRVLATMPKALLHVLQTEVIDGLQLRVQDAVLQATTGVREPREVQLRVELAEIDARIEELLG